MNLFQGRQALLDLLLSCGDFRPGSPTYDASMLAMAALQVARDAEVQGEIEREVSLPGWERDGLRHLSEVERVAILSAAHRALFNA